MENSFKEFFTYLMIFGFLLTFWNSFKADMERRDGQRSYANTNQTSGRVVRQKLYPAGYTGMPATVYYQH